MRQRVIWSAAGIVRKRFTFEERVQSVRLHDFRSSTCMPLLWHVPSCKLSLLYCIHLMDAQWTHCVAATWSLPWQVAWTRLASAPGGHPTLCMLHETALTLYGIDGELHTVPVPPGSCSSIHALPQGLLLSVRTPHWRSQFLGHASSQPIMCMHGLTIMQVVPFCPDACADNVAIWPACHFLLTHSQRFAAWSCGEGTAGKTAAC